ncbi:MAG: DUF3667 domain-containing protein [Pseudomonadota bacterium]
MKSRCVFNVMSLAMLTRGWKNTFADRYVVEMAETDDGRLSRICQHVIEADQALNQFLDHDAQDIEANLASQFGDAVEVTSRVLREDAVVDVPDSESPNCLNCGARLRGQYCGSCGQRSRSRLISLWELVRDAFGDLFELDSRLWKTLIPLLRKPGQLTADYLQGKRARYMPPFRMYLVLSLLFFVVAFFDPRDELSVFYEPEIAADLEDSAPISDEDVAARQAEIEAGLANVPESVMSDEQKAEIIAAVEENDSPLRITGGSGNQVVIGDECDVDLGTLDQDWPWLARRVTPERVQEMCERGEQDGWQWLAPRNDRQDAGRINFAATDYGTCTEAVIPAIASLLRRTPVVLRPFSLVLFPDLDSYRSL